MQHAASDDRGGIASAFVIWTLPLELNIVSSMGAHIRLGTFSNMSRRLLDPFGWLVQVVPCAFHYADESGKIRTISGQ